MLEFNSAEIKKLFIPKKNSNGEDNGQITIIGGSELFHGASLLSLKTASRVVDMVFFSSPDSSVGEIANLAKSKLFSFIWVPWDEVEDYIKKSDAVLIGPGMMRYHKEKDTNNNHDNLNLDDKGELTRGITKSLLQKFPDKSWVIDGGSLQTMDADWIPKNAILTPNKKEFKMLFGDLDPAPAARKYKCIIALKGPKTLVASENESLEVSGGNPGMTKGGTGDVQAGLTVAFLAKNDPMLAATAASFVVKKAAENLHDRVGIYFNADDLADQVLKTLKKLTDN